MPVMEDSKIKSTDSGGSNQKSDQNEPPKSAPTKIGGAMAAILHQSKTRRRKGSLRKTALLGPGKTPQPIIRNTPPSPASPVWPSRTLSGRSSPSSSSESLTIHNSTKTQMNSSAAPKDKELFTSSDRNGSIQAPVSSLSVVGPEPDSYFPAVSPRHPRPPSSRPTKKVNR